MHKSKHGPLQTLIDNLINFAYLQPCKPQNLFKEEVYQHMSVNEINSSEIRLRINILKLVKKCITNQRQILKLRLTPISQNQTIKN